MWSGRGIVGGRVSKVLSGTWETSQARKRSEESDEPIVAGKRGNARGCEGVLRVKSLHLTLVTTEGLKDSPYRFEVQSEITLDQLFEK